MDMAFGQSLPLDAGLAVAVLRLVTSDGVMLGIHLYSESAGVKFSRLAYDFCILYLAVDFGE